MKPKHIAIIGTVFATAAVGGVAAALSQAGSAGPHSLEASRSLGLISSIQTGTPITLPPGDARTARFTGDYQTLEKVAENGKSAYFTLQKNNGERCYAVGTSGATWPLGAVACRDGAPYFPSAAVPTLDLSVVEMTVGGSGMHYMNARGFAADGVAAVNALSGTGSVLARVPVDNNTYDADSLPDGVTQLVPVDASGNALP